MTPSTPQFKRPLTLISLLSLHTSLKMFPLHRILSPMCNIVLKVLYNLAIILSICRGVVGGWVGGTCPPSVGDSGNFRKFQNFISTAHVRDDVIGYGKKSVPPIESLPTTPLSICLLKIIQKDLDPPDPQNFIYFKLNAEYFVSIYQVAVGGEQANLLGYSFLPCSRQFCISRL